VDILINNAGIQVLKSVVDDVYKHVCPVEEFPIDKWNAIIAINLTAAFHTTQLSIKGMKARKWGRIINVASVHGLVASVNKSAYVAAKHGIVGFTKAVALEVDLYKPSHIYLRSLVLE
jgi:3-hydroxybutyrate dehydrogenase